MSRFADVLLKGRIAGSLTFLESALGNPIQAKPILVHYLALVKISWRTFERTAPNIIFWLNTELFRDMFVLKSIYDGFMMP